MENLSIINDEKVSKDIAKMLKDDGFYVKHIKEKNTPIKIPLEVVE